MLTNGTNCKEYNWMRLEHYVQYLVELKDIQPLFLCLSVTELYVIPRRSLHVWLEEVVVFEGPGHIQPMWNFWAVFYFCSDLPNFWHVSYKLIGKRFCVFFVGFRLVFEK